MNDQIKDIPKNLEKYLGTGQMVLPSEMTIRESLKMIPNDKLVSLPQLRRSIAIKFGVTTACPKFTLKAVKSLISDKDSTAYRVLNGKGELLSKDDELQGKMLTSVGFIVESSKKKPKILDYEKYLIA